jgi:hypothetical protein
MKIKLVIECNPIASDSEAEDIQHLFEQLVEACDNSDADMAGELGEKLKRIADWYSTDDSLPKDDPKRES